MFFISLYQKLVILMAKSCAKAMRRASPESYRLDCSQFRLKLSGGIGRMPASEEMRSISSLHAGLLRIP